MGLTEPKTLLLGSQAYLPGKWPPLKLDRLNPDSATEGEGATRSGENAIRVANNRKRRLQAYALANRNYLAKGYTREKGLLGLAHPYDRRPGTLTLLSVDAQDRAIATVTLVPDGADGLPCDSVFGQELKSLRTQGRRLVEVTRLAVESSHPEAAKVRINLFSAIYAFARETWGGTDFVIEVNPRHCAFYRRCFRFETLGLPQPCPRVQGAPASLMRLDLKAAGNHNSSSPKKGLLRKEDREFDAHRVATRKYMNLVNRLQKAHRPMSVSEAQFFGL